MNTLMPCEEDEFLEFFSCWIRFTARPIQNCCFPPLSTNHAPPPHLIERLRFGQAEDNNENAINPSKFNKTLSNY